MGNNIPHKGIGHRARLRDKFLESGLSGFHDYEVIELLLTLATPRKDCKEAAKEILSKFKSFQNVFEASTKELCEIKGIGPVNVFGIKLVKAVADRILEKKIINQDIINSSSVLIDYCYHNMRDKNRECFKALFLDSKNRVLGIKTLFEGTLNSSAVYPREVVQSALNNKAAALIFIHNHPSGDPTPSSEDISITRQLVFACKMMGIIVHEHLIIGDSKYFSFADHGHITRFHQEYDNQQEQK